VSEEINRRDFMKRATVTAVGAGLSLSALSARNVLGANEKVRVGVIGSGQMGIANMEAFLKHPQVEIVAVCDVYQPNLNKGLKAAGGKAQTYKDFRRILDRQDIDAVLVATPDHWHALMSIMACQAGKDVYVEKPVSTFVEEGKYMVKTARKYNRVVQVGMLVRSWIHTQEAVKLVRDGFLGQVHFVRAWTYGNEHPEGIGNPPDSAPPADLDWDLWLGPAPKVPYNWNRFGVGDRWSTFRYFWDYAGGEMTDIGVHRLDIVQWAMNVEGPTNIVALGGKYCLKDNRETPETLQVTYEYPGWVCVFETRRANAHELSGKGSGITFHGTEATLFLDYAGLRVYPEKRMLGKKEVDRSPAMQMDMANDAHVDHVANFLACIKSRQRPIADIEIGHRSSTTCHLANIAYRSQERLVWDVASEQLREGSAEAKKLLNREYRAPWKLSV